MLSATAENYVKQLYLIGGKRTSATATTQSVADALHVTPASATGMLQRLAELQLVEYTAYHGATLTAQGRDRALALVRRHRLLELFLHRVLGYALDEVHDEAEALEHAISEKFETRIDALLNHPEFDPHGDPIPRQSGEMPDRAGIALSAAEDGAMVRILRIPGEGSLLASLARLSVTPGQSCRVVRVDAALGVISLDVSGKVVTLSAGAANQVLVEPIFEATR